MKPFMDDNFLLDTEVARKLYHTYAKAVPILDYHCHISPKDIAQDKKFKNITQLWLGGDHYKWRLMRANGIEEAYITGDAADYDKFKKWAVTLEKAVGNPLFHWSHLELQRFFDYHGILSSQTAEKVWELCNQKLSRPDMSVRNLILRSHVTLLCTTDDPADDLRWHHLLAEDSSFPVKVLPAFRPDKAMNIEKTDYTEYIQRLEEAASLPITCFQELKTALRQRMEFFDGFGCRTCDHALEYVMYYPDTEETINEIFIRRLSGQLPTYEEELKFKTAFLRFAAKEYSKLGWVMQLHFGCRRDNNTAMYRLLGPDTGYDSIGSCAPANQLSAFLNSLHQEGQLPKIVLYSLNPNDDDAINSILGCFQDGDIMGKLQQGSAWWFNDHKTGMQKQLTTLANLGLLGNFIGMLTDSRSFISYPRHEYFRRILCQLIGQWVENGEFPFDERMLKPLIQNISYNNAVRYFGFPLECIGCGETVDRL